ncbi:hypothetical protein CLAIMM_08652 [Cladophialophora immunda]|nr:hypothetical protein CLAIMM_08652 [Cladophialophora immunda]
MLETSSGKKTISFNNEVQQVLFLRDDVIGQEIGLTAAQLSGVPSVAWQVSQLEKGILQRERCFKKARDGCMPACVMLLQHRDSSKRILNSGEEHANDNGGEIGSTTASFAKMTLATSVTAPDEIRVRHLLLGNLYFQAVQEIEDAVRHRLSTLAVDLLDSKGSTGNSLRSVIEDLQKRTTERFTELLKHLGVIYPYHSQGERYEAVEDARRDKDWTEVDAKAEALFISCASPWVVETLRDIIAQFKRKLDRKIRSRIQ